MICNLFINNSIAVENSFEDSQLSQLQILRRFSVSKSKLPPSHMPDAQEKESDSTKLINKLQAMNKSEEVEEDSKQDSQKDSKTAPKFLVIDTTEEELEELAKIDAELAKANDEEMWQGNGEEILVRNPR